MQEHVLLLSSVELLAWMDEGVFVHCVHVGSN